MNTPLRPDRRDFLKLTALTATAALLPQVSQADQIGPLFSEKLPYAFDALEPHIDAKTMEIHHDKHHAAYIKNFNEMIGTAPWLVGKSLMEILGSLPSIEMEMVRTSLRNNGGGHWNHEFFWNTLTPAAKSGKPTDTLAAAIEAELGGMDAFKKSFAEAATKRFGSGWAWLIVQEGKLKITSTANQDNPLMKGSLAATELGTPLLALDVWEHAYYLHYQNRRPEYISAWWNIVNWPTVSARYAKAMA
jgi:superoxide dismutase, Fe-Mn family